MTEALLFFAFLWLLVLLGWVADHYEPQRRDARRRNR